MKKYVIGAVLLMTMLPAPVRADWLFSPGIGTTFGADSNGREHFTYVASLGWMSSGVFGWELDVSFTPEFFKGNDDDFDFDGSSNVVTAMGNAIIGVPIGGQQDGGFRPYLTSGLGMLQTEARTNDDLLRVDNSEFGFNVGAGAIGFFSDHIGVRGDIRYLRSFEDPEEDNEFDLGVGNFDYWRAAAGLTFRW